MKDNLKSISRLAAMGALPGTFRQIGRMKSKCKILDAKNSLRLCGATDGQIEKLESEHGKWDELAWDLIHFDYMKNGSFSDKSDYALSKRLHTETMLNLEDSIYLARWAIEKGLTAEQLRPIVDTVISSGRPVTVYSVIGMIEKLEAVK